MEASLKFTIGMKLTLSIGWLSPVVNKAGISIYGRLSLSAGADTRSVQVDDSSARYGRDREWVSAALLVY